MRCILLTQFLSKPSMTLPNESSSTLLLILSIICLTLCSKSSPFLSSFASITNTITIFLLHTILVLTSLCQKWSRSFHLGFFNSLRKANLFKLISRLIPTRIRSKRFSCVSEAILLSSLWYWRWQRGHRFCTFDHLKRHSKQNRWPQTPVRRHVIYNLSKQMAQVFNGSDILSALCSMVFIFIEQIFLKIFENLVKQLNLNIDWTDGLLNSFWSEA